MPLKIIFNERPRNSWQLFRNILTAPVGRSYSNNEIVRNMSSSSVDKNHIRINSRSISLLDHRLLEAGIKEFHLDGVSTFTLGRTINEILTSRNIAEAAQKLGKSNFDTEITQLPTGESQLSVELSRPDFFHLRDELSPSLEIYDIGCGTGIITGLSGIIGGGMLGNNLGSDNNFGFNLITSLLGSALGMFLIPFTYSKLQDLMRIGMDTVKCGFQFPALIRIQNEAFGSISETDFKKASQLLNAVTTATALELSRLWHNSPGKGVKIAEVSGGFNAKIAALSNLKTDLLVLIPYLNDVNERIRIKAISSILERKPTADLIRAIAKDSQSKPEIHLAIAEHEDTPDDVIEYYLMGLKAGHLTEKAAQFALKKCISIMIRPGISQDILRRISKSPDYNVQRAIATFVETPADILEQYLEDGICLDSVVPRIVNPGISPDDLRRLSKSQFSQVQCAIARIPETPRDILEGYLTEEKALELVLPRLFPPDADPEQLRELSTHENDIIHNFLANHKQTPRDVLIQLLDITYSNTNFIAATRLLSEDCGIDMLLKISDIFAIECKRGMNSGRAYWKVLEIARKKDCEPQIIAQLLSTMPADMYFSEYGMISGRTFAEINKGVKLIKSYPIEKQTKILTCLASLNPDRAKEITEEIKKQAREVNTSRSPWQFFSRRPN